MRKRLFFYSGLALLTILVAVIVWQGSFTFGPLAPSSVEQTYIFWAVSTVIFILTVMLGFLLFRTFVKLYVDRQSHRAGSHIRSKLVAGALALTFLPVFFLILFSVNVLNYNLNKWFSRPADIIQSDLIEVGNALDREVADRLTAQAHWLAAVLESGDTLTAAQFCDDQHAGYAAVQQQDGNLQVVCGADSKSTRWTYARIPVPQGTLVLAGGLPLDLAAKKAEIDRSVLDSQRQSADRYNFRKLYLELLLLITLFILFFATWMARYLASQISIPITALLTAAQEIRKGNLGYRVNVTAIDELRTRHLGVGSAGRRRGSCPGERPVGGKDHRTHGRVRLGPPADALGLDQGTGHGGPLGLVDAHGSRSAPSAAHCGTSCNAQSLDRLPGVLGTEDRRPGDEQSAPAAAACSMVSRSIPPSTWTTTLQVPGLDHARRARRTLASISAMNDWPPKPGSTVITSRVS